MEEQSTESNATLPTAEEIPVQEQKVFLVCAILGLGPLALPFIWRHPRLKWHWKVAITLGVIALTWGCIVLTKVMIGYLQEQWQIIQELRS